MRKYIALTAVLLLVGVGCKSTSSDDAGTKTTTTVKAGEVVEDDRAPGVTDDAIKVGIAYPDFEALGDAVNINHGDYEAAYTAVIDDINEKGGVHGRELEAVFGPVDPSSATSTDDVCTKLTQDDPVFVAIGLFFGESVMCFVNVNETAVVGGEMTDERVAQARAPWFAYDVSSDSQVDAVNKLIDADDLKGKVAVIMTDQDQALYESRIKPVLDDADVEVVETSILNTALDPEQLTGESRTAFQRFEAADAPTVLALGQGTAGAVSDGLSDSNYNPQLLFTSTNSVNAYAKDETRDASVFEGAVGVGVFGPPDEYLTLGGITEECLDVVRDAGVTITKPSEVAEGDPNSIVSALAACQQLELLTALLDDAGEDLNYGTFTTAGYDLGEIELPGEPEPFFFGPPPHSDGDRPLYRYECSVDDRQFEPAS